MKRIICLALVLVLVFAFSPMAYAETPAASASNNKLVNDLVLWVIRDLELLYNINEVEGIVSSNGHLVTCNGEECYCLAILVQAEKEYQEQKRAEELPVIVSISYDENDVRNDLVITKVKQSHNLEGIQENQAYLDSNDAVAKLFEEFVDADEQARKLYFPIHFIHGQVEDRVAYSKTVNLNGPIHLEYRIMDKRGLTLGLLDEESEAGDAENVIFSREAIELDIERLMLRLGNIIMVLPEACKDMSFSFAASFYENGSVRLLLADEAGKPIPGAVLRCDLPQDADEKTVAAVQDGDGFKALDTESKGGCLVFTAPSGDDVFALIKK